SCLLFKRPEPIATGVDREDLIAGWTLVEDDWGRLPQEKRGSDGLQVRRQRGSRVSPAGGPAASGRDPARSNLRGRTRQTDPWPRPAGRSGTSLVSIWLTRLSHARSLSMAGSKQDQHSSVSAEPKVGYAAYLCRRPSSSGGCWLRFRPVSSSWSTSARCRPGRWRPPAE